MAESAAGAASEVAGWGCVAGSQEQLLSRMVPRAVVANAEPVPGKTLFTTWHTESFHTILSMHLSCCFNSNTKTFRGNWLRVWRLQVDPTGLEM